MAEDLLRKIDDAAARTQTSQSEFTATVFEAWLGALDDADSEGFRAMFWRLKSTGYLRARPPRYPGRTGGRWVVEEVPPD